MCYVAVPYIIAAVAAAGSAYQSSQTSKNQANYQAKVNANNAKTAEWQAADAKARGDAAAVQTRRKYAALQGTQRASLAARGLDISDGSANAVLTDTEFFGQLDENLVHANAAREAWGYKTQGTNFASNAAAFNASADGQNPALSGAMAGAASWFGGGGARSYGNGGGGASSGSMLSGSGTVDSRWYGSGTTMQG